MVKIRHDISDISENIYFLNGVCVWYSKYNYNVHVGTLGSLDIIIEDAVLHNLAKLLHSKSGQYKIDTTDPNIMNFLKLTKCLP